MNENEMTREELLAHIKETYIYIHSTSEDWVDMAGMLEHIMDRCEAILRANNISTDYAQEEDS